MSIIAFCNQKGGVGKTTMALHAAFYARRRGRSVCLVDLDSQANATAALCDAAGIERLDRPLRAASALFTGSPTGPLTLAEGLALYPADAGLNEVERLPLEAVQQAGERLAELAGYDYLIIDTPPTLGNRLVAALFAADRAVAPLMPAGFAIQGVSDLLRTVQQIQGYNARLQFAGLLLNKVNPRSGSQRAAIEALRAELGARVLPVVVYERAAVGDALDEGRPVWHATRGESAYKAGQEMLAAMADLFARIEQGGVS